MENEKCTLYDKKTENHGKWETHTVGPWIGQETVKILKNEKYKCRTCILARILKNVENETQIWYDLEYGKKHWKKWKMWNAPCRTWNIVRKLKKKKHRKWYKHCLTWNIARNTQKHGKWEMHTEGPRVWRENGKSWKMRNTHCRMSKLARNTEKPEKWELHTIGTGLWRGTWKTWKMRHTQ